MKVGPTPRESQESSEERKTKHAELRCGGEENGTGEQKNPRFRISPIRTTSAPSIKLRPIFDLLGWFNTFHNES